MLTYLLAVLGAGANASSSVLQRKANREAPRQDNLITLALAAWLFHAPMRGREWAATAAMSAGLAGLLYFLAPSPGRASGVPWTTWVAGVGASLALVAALVAWGRRGPAGRGTSAAGSSARQAAVLGVAAGAAFGLTAALMKGMTATFAGGIGALLTSWPLYAMIATGVGAMFVLQSALNAGRLVAAQPGMTLADPVISVAWGVLVFHERVRGGPFLIAAAVSLAVLAGGVLVLARSPLLDDQE